MTKYRQKENEAVIKVTNDIEVIIFIDMSKKIYSAGNSRLMPITLKRLRTM